MSVDINVSITEDIVDIIATPTVNIVNVTNSASIDPGLYDLSEFTNTSSNPFVRTSGLSSYVPASRTLTINGTTQDLSANRTFTISTGLSVGTTPIASGTIGRVLFEGTGNVLQQSGNLFWDNTNGRLGVGTSAPTERLSVNGNISFTAPGYLISSTNNIMIGQDSAGNYLFAGTNAANTPPRLFIGRMNTSIEFQTDVGQERMRIASGGNVLINTTTDAGYKLDVNGSARVQGNLLVDTLGTNNEATLGGTLQLISSIAVINNAQTAWISFATRNTSGSEVVYDLSNVGNIIAAGNVGIGTSSPLVSLDIRTSDNSPITPLSSVPNTATTLLVGNTGTNGVLSLGQNNTGQSWIQGRSRLGDGSSFPILLNPLGGNILIGTTTDAGYKLDVNGTARVSGNVEVSTTNATFTIKENSGVSTNAASLVINNSVNAITSLLMTQTTATVLNRQKASQSQLYGNGAGGIAITAINTSSTATIDFISKAFPSAAASQLNMRIDNDGNVIVNGTTANASARMQVDSTTQGFLPPRMTTTERNAIASPAAGLIVYDNTDNKHYGYNGTTWNAFY